MATSYKGFIRTNLSCDERKALKQQASQKGMTLTGYIDALLRSEIKGKETAGLFDQNLGSENQ